MKKLHVFARAVIAIGLAAVFCSLDPGPSMAAGWEFCHAYSQNAAVQIEAKDRFRCGGTGPQWGTNRREHFDWCRAAEQDSAEREERNRLGRLAACSKQAVCAAYAKTAVGLNRQRESLRCHVGGARWHSNEGSHFGWCMSAPQNWIESESISRLHEINACDKCARYAEISVVHNKLNRDRGCNFSGDPWSDDWGGHYRWCVGADQSELNQEHSHRRGALRSCGIGFPP